MKNKKANKEVRVAASTENKGEIKMKKSIKAVLVVMIAVMVVGFIGYLMFVDKEEGFVISNLSAEGSVHIFDFYVQGEEEQAASIEISDEPVLLDSQEVDNFDFYVPGEEEQVTSIEISDEPVLLDSQEVDRIREEIRVKEAQARNWAIGLAVLVLVAISVILFNKSKDNEDEEDLYEEGLEEETDEDYLDEDEEDIEIEDLMDRIYRLEKTVIIQGFSLIITIINVLIIRFFP